MKIKSYEAKSMREAVKKIKHDLGPDALILNTRYITKRKWWGFRKDKLVEVVAGIAERKTISTKEIDKSNTSAQNDSSNFKEETKTSHNIRLVIDNLAKHISELGIEKELTRRIVYIFEDIITGSINFGRRLDRNSVKKEFLNQLSRIIPISPGIDFDNLKEQKIIALVGPTGVGKTTTIAKLAAIASVLKHRKVGLLSIDAYRISAYEQLKTYAEIIGLPVKLALSPKEAIQAIDEYYDKEIILVDTVGRSPQHEIHMKELHSYINAIDPTELHLTLSASVKYSDIMSIIKKYEDMAINKLIFTKIDETVSLDSLVNSIYKTKYPLSYFCTGQSVPDDIEVAHINKIVDFLVNEKNLDEIVNVVNNSI